ncbi:hypothetical protein GCM10020369_58340 [Cryptosporangium minutisporangium]|uniref:Uncharacterized protein n=1 Tax=Cryptosporangium minutisporangium TaxID=113569 RepID=A0ABP6T707_9ACTN
MFGSPRLITERDLLAAQTPTRAHRSRLAATALIGLIRFGVLPTPHGRAHRPARPARRPRPAQAHKPQAPPNAYCRHHQHSTLLAGHLLTKGAGFADDEADVPARATSRLAILSLRFRHDSEILKLRATSAIERSP